MRVNSILTNIQPGDTIVFRTYQAYTLVSFYREGIKLYLGEIADDKHTIDPLTEKQVWDIANLIANVLDLRLVTLAEKKHYWQFALLPRD